MVHPTSLSDLGHEADAARPTGLVTSAVAPNERMPMGIPVGRSIMDRLADVSPGFETAALLSQRAQCLPPRLDQVQVGGVLGLEDELPALMSQGKQEHVHGPMRRQVVQNRVHPVRLGWQPGVYLFQEGGEVDRRTALISRGQGLAGGWAESAEDVTLAASAIVRLLLGALGRVDAIRYMDQATAGMTPGRFRPHFVQADRHAVRRRLRVELRDAPLFSANSGSTRSPNQVSCLRQRKPSRSRRSSIRLRLIGMPFVSFRYASRRSSVHEANGSPNFWGLVSAAAMTSPTCSAEYVGGLPERGLSSKPSMPFALKRLSQRRIVSSSRCNSSAISGTALPSCESHTILARSTAPAGSVRLCANRLTASLSAAV